MVIDDCCDERVKSVRSRRRRRTFNTAKRLIHHNHTETVDRIRVVGVADSASWNSAGRAASSSDHSARLAENARIYSSSSQRTRLHGSSVTALTTSRQRHGARSVTSSATTQPDQVAVTDKLRLTTLRDGATGVTVNSEPDPRCNEGTVISAGEHETSNTDNTPPANVRQTKKKRKTTKPEGSVFTSALA